MLQWLKRRYIPYLLLYVAILFVVVFLVLFGIFKLLPSESVFSLDISQTEAQNDIVLPYAYDGIHLDYYNNDQIDLSVIPAWLPFAYWPLYSFNLRFSFSGGNEIILVDESDEQIVIQPNTQHGFSIDVPYSNIDAIRSGDWIHILSADEESPESSYGNEPTSCSPLLSVYTWPSPSDTPSFRVYNRYSWIDWIDMYIDLSDRSSPVAKLSVRENTQITFDLDAFAVSDAFYFRIKKIILPESTSSLWLDVYDTEHSNTSIYDLYYDSALLRIVNYPLDSDYKLTAHFLGDTEITGDGTLYYSSYTSDKEYPLHMQSIQLKNADANLTLINEAKTTSIKLNGSADDVLRSGVSLKPSIFNWISESIAILPTFLLTVFGGAITISLRMWDKANARASAAKQETCPCEPTPQRRRGNPQVRRPASIHARRKTRADREKRIAASADASPQ